MSIQSKIIKTCYHFKLGHVGSCMSVATIIPTILSLLEGDDTIIMSKGHAGVAHYCGVLGLIDNYVAKKLPNVTTNMSLIFGNEVVYKDHEWLPNMEILPEHPEKNERWKVPCLTGSLGHGLPVAVGIAKGKPNSNVYVILSDGELNEGSNYEAIQLAHELKLRNLYIIIDSNGFQGYRKTRHNVTSFYGIEQRTVKPPRLKEEILLQKHNKLVKMITVITEKKVWQRETSNLDSHYKQITDVEYKEFLKNGGEYKE